MREDLKSGELSLSMFAADLYDVALCQGNKIYSDPKEFFSFTYPTFNIRELSKDVAIRLAGKSDKAVRQLELTYGGGKTHTLITLYHLFNKPEKLPMIQSVKEFIEHIGFTPPKARIVILSFDKIDVEKGVETISPAGEKRWLRNPWSILAFQIAGSEGIKLLNSQEKDEERETAPAENLLTTLLQVPEKEGLSTLILIDEVLMYAREKVAQDPLWRIKLTNFFQYLTQSATKVRKCAIVASLLATDPRKNDDLGKQIIQELYAVFRRERDESVQPVVKEDVAEVLRRRFFTPDSIMDREAFRPHVLAAMKGISEFDDQIHKEGKIAEDRYLRSYPFHPDLTEVFYTKWTNLEGFQRTRGVLRTYALALREAEKWDLSPLIGPTIFLASPGKSSISMAARELTVIAETEESHGKKQDWTSILESELEKAIKIQSGLGGLKNREIEQSVFTVFLHSQPIGQKVSTKELLI
ncbi:ATP-binding protein, partial [Candidatus Bathyarchaeota archaeon]|nr:ATP-binding protein [Candidatus Bathyarchaeota archaeon]